MQISINFDGVKTKEFNFGKHKIRKTKDMKLYSNSMLLGLSLFNIDKILEEKVFELFEPIKWLLGYKNSIPLIRNAFLFAMMCIVLLNAKDIKDYIDNADSISVGVFKLLKIFTLIILGIVIIL